MEKCLIGLVCVYISIGSIVFAAVYKENNNDIKILSSATGKHQNSLNRAKDIVLNQIKGKMTDIKVEKHGGHRVYDIDVLSSGNSYDVTLDFQKEKVLSMKIGE